MCKRATIAITGTVQGVGFRPFVYKKATEMDLRGYVLNTGDGVKIDAEGDESRLEEFIHQVCNEAPTNAVIDSCDVTYEEPQGYRMFEICESAQGECDLKAIIPPDYAICPDCLHELQNKRDSRYHYPFINCVNCGPRYSIVKKIPYDRPNTSMDVFEMCPSCEKEYKNPKDRRYHAQPISCPECGPKLTLHRSNGSLLTEGYKAIETVAKLIAKGHIVAIKGVGGFHLVCDASKNRSVLKLREKKNRPQKPFAVMFRSVYDMMKCSDLLPEEEELIRSPERPIVLITKRKPHRLEKFCISCDGIAPGVNRIGVFLPYSPIHVMLMEQVKCPIIATSANISDEPIITDSAVLLEKLGDVVDYYLDYDREIVNPCDDSVAMIQDGSVQFVRKSRGFSPECIKLPVSLDKKVLAVGGHLKNTIAIGFGNNAAISPHIGDLSGIDTMEYFERTVKMFEGVYGFNPDVIVCDKHPGYESTKWAKAQGIPLLQVQHHYAHILSLMAEHQITGPILGVAWDGTGYGDDGTLWGGEFFKADLNGYERIVHFESFKLLGGEKAVKEPKRVALSILFDLYGEAALDLDIPLLKQFEKEEIFTLYEMHQKSLNAPLSSSVGRLFDAVAAIFDVVYTTTYEGETGLKMETLYDDCPLMSHYPFEIHNGVIYYKEIFKEMLKEPCKERALSKFINTLCHIIVAIAKEQKLPVGLSGGVFQNKILTTQLLELLNNYEIPYYIHQKVPPNDGGISLGQIIYAATHDS